MNRKTHFFLSVIAISSVLCMHDEVACSFQLRSNAKTTAVAKKNAAGQQQQLQQQRLAVVDLRRVAAESNAGKGIERQVAEENNRSKKELLDLESKIKSMEANKLSRSTDSEKIEDLQLILYDMVKERRSKIAAAYEKAIAALESAIKDAIREVSEEQQIDAVLAADAVVFSGSNCKDITAETLKIVNQKCEHITLIVDGKENG